MCSKKQPVVSRYGALVLHKVFQARAAEIAAATAARCRATDIYVYMYYI